MKFTVCLILASVLFGVALSATSSSLSTTSASFNSTPYKVFDVSNATAATGLTQKDSTADFKSVIFSSVIFGASNTSNDTIWAWGSAYTITAATSSAPAIYSITAVTKRFINATIAAWGNDTTLNAVTAADVTTSSLTWALRGGAKFAAGGGYYAVSGVVAGPPDVLNVYLFNGASTGVTATRVAASAAASSVATVTTTAVATTLTTTPTFAVDSIWYEDGYFYVLYETQQTVTGGASPVYSVAGLYLQAVSTSSATNLYTAAMSVGTVSETITVVTLNTAIVGAIGAGSNSSQSTYVLVQYKDTLVSAVATVLKYAVITRATGAVSTAATTIGTDSSSTVYYAGGFISSNYTYGIIYANRTGASGSYVYGQMALLNGSAVSAATPLNAISTTSATSAVMTMGFRYTTGYGVVTALPTGTNTNSFVLQPYLANGTANGTSATTLGSIQGQANAFIDINGAVWFGYAGYDTTGTSPVYTPYSAFVAKLVGSVNTAVTTTGANILATFAAFISFVIVSLFMF